MNKNRIKTCFYAPLLLLTIVGTLFALNSFNGGIAKAATAQKCGQWSIIPSVNPTATDILYGVSAISANDVWSVGIDLNSSGFSQTLAEQWNGKAWKAISTPDIGGYGNYLRGVVALSANNVWAVGDYQSMKIPERTLIEHWNGTAWSIIHSPDRGMNDFLFHVSAVSANDIWAVGYSANNTTYRTLIEHWDGTAWKIVPSPNLGTGLNMLNSVAAVSATDVWSDGVAGNKTLIEHWNGSSWSIVASPNPNTLSNGLYGMTALSANNVWAAGNGTASNSSAVTLIEHWNGTAWKAVASPSPQLIHAIPNSGGEPTTLFSVTAVTANNIWAVGDYINSNGIYQTMIEHWNGKSWSLVSSPNVNGANSYLRDTTTIAGTTDTWTVGYSTANGITGGTLTEFYC